MTEIQNSEQEDFSYSNIGIYKTSRKPQAFKPGDEWCPERSQVKPGEAEQISI